MSASSIKTVLVLAVLAVVGYGVYFKINSNPSNPPPKAVEGWSAQPPKIELSGPGSPAPAFGVANGPNANRPNPFTLNIPAPGPTASPPSAFSSPSSYPGKAEVSSDPGSGRAPADPFANNNTRWPDANPSQTGTRPGVAVVQQNNNSHTPPASAPAGSMADDRSSDEVRRAFAAMMESAAARLNRGELAEVHLVLSEWYGDPRLPVDQARQLAELLSQLAGTVIYSRESLLERPYVVQAGDTLERIGQSYHVPWEMLAKINNIRSPDDLRPGKELKVLRGPFNAIVDLTRYELVLMLDGRYAGKFAIGVGRDCPPLERQYVVRGKMVNPASYSPGQPPDSGRSLGSRWIDLGGGLGIHGTSSTQDIGRNGGQGVIFMAERDVEDLYDILTIGTNGSDGSNVIIRR